MIGFLTAAFPDLTLGEVASWAASEGFETLEIRVGPLPAASAGVTRASLTSTWTLSTRTRCTNYSVSTDSRSRRSRTTRITSILTPHTAKR
jgi:sugar phosphate isomerase/epimerase